VSAVAPARAREEVRTESRVRLAVPNKGRLVEPTIALLRDAGLVFEDHERSLVSHCENHPLDILFVRTEDVVEFVSDGVAELGITGTNLLAESGVDLPILAQLGYGRCRLEAAVPSDAPQRTLEDLAGLRLATSHPRTAARTLAERGIAAEIVPLSGAVEVAPRMGLADGIVDLVSTGSTLVMNGLRSLGVLLASEAILVTSDEARRGRAEAVAHLTTMLESVTAGRRRKYLMMNAPRSALEEIEAVLPGLESPSIIPLAHEGMVAVHAVVGADEVWGLLARLRSAGASGILVVPIEKLLP
jgi:ATP phosphoribosyltransferase